MRHPLHTFTNFANSLLPHETEYLMSVQQLQDEERLTILRQVDYNAHHIGQFTPYDTSIDKRKYHHLQRWIQDKLSAVDVDEQLKWMLDMEQKINTDNIRSAEEKQLLKAIRSYRHPAFFFAKFYELVEQYRHFLLIRLRYADHQLADDFLRSYRPVYTRSRAINEQLHDATLDIVGQYSGQGGDSKQWIGWLSEVFYNEQVDGCNRYLALVRLVFISHNYRQYDLLREKFDYLDRQFSQGKYYSKRLLLNYYSNRLMLHSNFREYERAAHYGYLSIRARNHDYLLYVNNLCAVLMRTGRYQEALQLIQQASPEARKTKNFHNRIGYVSFYMEALISNGMYKNAEGYGASFLKAYAKEILQYRWHLFFSVFLESMLYLGHYEALLKVSRKYRLTERDKAYRTNAGYLPIIPLYIEIARYKEGIIAGSELQQVLQMFTAPEREASEKYRNLWEKVKHWIPEVISAHPTLLSRSRSAKSYQKID